MTRSSISFLILCAGAFSICSCKSDPADDAPPEKTAAFSNGETPAFKASASEHPSQIVFQAKSLPRGMTWKNSTLSLDSKRYIWSDYSMRWDWKKDSSIRFDRPIPWMKPKAARRKHKFSQPTQNCFVVWVYNAEAKPTSTLRFSFGKGDKEVCHFPFALNFTGWRTAWVSFDRDMQGKPDAPMDYVKIESPDNIDQGTLWIGDILAHQFIDHRHQHGDYQVPFVHGADKLTHGHWDPIMHWYDLGKKQAATATVTKPTDAQMAAFAKFRRLARGSKQQPLDQKTIASIEKQFAKYHISKNSDGIQGDHIAMQHHLAGAPDSSLRRNHHSLKNYTGFMQRVAQTYSRSLPADRESAGGKRIAEIFCLLTEHMLDQGFAAGSSLGTMHHFGYNARAWVPAIEAMQEPLEATGLLTAASEALQWFYNTRQMYAPAADWANMDYLNTLSKSDFTIQCIGKDGPEKVARLTQYSKWISETLSSPSPGLKGGIKPDGSLFHHQMHYVGYGVPAIKVVTQSVVAPLDGTPFEITPAAYAQLKKVFMAARLWGYPHSGFNACGRHPITSSGEQLSGPMRLLAKSKPGTDEVDAELASGYLRMFGGDSKKMFGKEIAAEKLHAFHPMNYNGGGEYAFGNSTVHIKGYGDGIRSHETYKAANRYGRNLSHGTVQVFKNTFDHVSGQDAYGWDWCRLPGATTLRVPLDVLEGNTRFYGSTPKQRTYPSGAGSLDGKYGAFLFQLDPTSAKQSLRVRKSVFAIDRTLVCLGSGISNASKEYPTVTTIFQSAIPKKGALSRKGDGWFIDPYGTGYFIPNGQSVKHTTGKQESRHSHTKKKTSGHFSTAWLDHGTAPKDASYQYHIILDATPEAMKAWKKTQTSQPHIKVIRQDDTAHVIHCPAKKIEATAAFAAYQSSANTLLLSTDRSSIVIIRQEDESTLKLSVTDIDLPDVGSAPQSTATTVTLKGTWTINEKTDVVSSHEGEKTKMVIPTHRGTSRELTLTRS